MGSALLAACGGGGEEAGAGVGGQKDTSGLLATIEDRTKEAKKGGTFVFNSLRDPVHFDGQAQGQIQLNVFNGMAYEALVRNKEGYKQNSTWSEVEPQLAESWEVSPDKLTITFTLRKGVKWHNKPPVNGRAFDSSDVIASAKRYRQHPTVNNKGANWNEANAAAPLMSVEAPDAYTVVYKLKEPASYIFQRFANMITGELGSIYPRETGDTFDPRTEQIGTGPYIRESFLASQETVYKRNPEYWDSKNAGHFDTVRIPLLGEYAAQLAQLKAGTLSSIDIQQTDVLQTKKDVPALSMYAYADASNNPFAMMRFGWLPIDGKKSPFLDQRVRQALSMAFDRESYIDTFYEVSKLEAAGLPVNTYWFTSIGFMPGWWLDPRGKEFGENAKYYQYNVAEAKKLIEAARSAYGGDFPEIPAARVNVVFAPPYPQQCDVMDQWASEIGLKVKVKPLDYNLEYLPKYVTQQGQFSGYLYGIGAVSSPDAVDYYTWRFYSKSGATSGALGFGGPNGSLGDKSGDPEVDALIEKGKGEFDVKKRQALVHDLQRVLAKQAYGVAQPGNADRFQLVWPAIANMMTWQNGSRIFLWRGITSAHTLWYDATKPHKA